MPTYSYYAGGDEVTFTSSDNFYTFDYETNDYIHTGEPSAEISNYYYYDEQTASYEGYTPSFDLYDFNEATQSYESTRTADLTAQAYYFFDEPSQSYFTLNPATIPLPSRPEETPDLYSPLIFNYHPPTPLSEMDLTDMGLTMGDFDTIPEPSPNSILYIYDQNTEGFSPVPEPSPYVSSYYFYDEPSSSFYVYPEEPTLPTTYYYYDEPTDHYYEVSEPDSDIEVYYSYDAPTESFYYIPSPYTSEYTPIPYETSESEESESTFYYGGDVESCGVGYTEVREYYSDSETEQCDIESSETELPDCEDISEYYDSDYSYQVVGTL